MIIYADVLFILNLFVNYALLLSVCTIIHEKPPFWRMLCSSLFGSFCSFIILLPPLNVLIGFAIKIAVSLIMTAIAFSFGGIKPFLRKNAWLLAVTFAYCGIMTAIESCFNLSSMSVNNLAVYLNISPLTLVLSTSICYVAIKMICAVVGKLNKNSGIYEIEIYKAEKSIKCKAILDTGCNLRDLYSGNPVVVVEKSLAMSLIPNRITSPNGSNEEEICAYGMRLLPYTAIDGKGMMQAFGVDKAIIYSKNKAKTICKITVAISNTEFCDTYSALFGTDVADLI